MRAATRPRLRAAGDAKGGTRRVPSRILLVLALALTGWVAAFARLRRSALSGADDFGIRRSGHREDPRTTTRRTATFDAGRPIHSANTDNPQKHDTPTLRRVVGVPLRSTTTAAPYTPPAEPGGAVTFVLVSTMNPDSAPRVAHLLASMRAFLTANDTNDEEPPRGGSSERVVAELLVLVPDAELDWWALAAAALGADAPWGKTRVVPESRALPTPAAEARALAPGAARREARGLGYRTQMLLKLAAGALVRTPFYVTLDCDVVLRGALRAEDMLDASRRRALAQGAMGGRHASRWLSHSLDALFGETPGAAAEAAKAAKALESDEGTGSVSMNHRLRSFASKVASCGADATSRGVGVTPAILSAALAKRAVAFLDEPSVWPRSGDAERTRWDARLFRSLDSGLDWTEYGIYAAFACVEGTFGETHFVDATRELYDAKLQEDGSKFADAGAMRAAFGAGEGKKKRALFVVVQSIGGSDPVGAASAVRPFLLGDA